MKNKILEVKNLDQHFHIPAVVNTKKSLVDKIFPKKQILKAVDNISFSIYEGETLGLVGESGSGKSTVGRTLIRLYDPTGGEINFNGRNIAKKCRNRKNYN